MLPPLHSLLTTRMMYVCNIHIYFMVALSLGYASRVIGFGYTKRYLRILYYMLTNVHYYTLMELAPTSKRHANLTLTLSV